jgi:hypothetical protein
MTFYEQLGIVIPGSVFVFGLLIYFPALQALTGKEGVSVGEFGLFVLLAYAAGHLIAAIANTLEAIFWRCFRGMPSDWVVAEKTTLLSPQQLDQLRLKVRSRLKIKISKLVGMERKVWWPISRQIYADVARNGKPDRIDTFNGNYGLNRGLASACIALAAIAAFYNQWLVVLALGAAAAIYGYRAYRFGVHYARELYLQFLILDKPK